MTPGDGARNEHKHRLADLTDHGAGGSLAWPLTISHRGGTGVYPEHSWEAKSGSIASGFIPEFDLRLLADGRTLVNCHDVTVDRTMNNIGTGPVSSKTVSSAGPGETGLRPNTYSPARARNLAAMGVRTLAIVAGSVTPRDLGPGCAGTRPLAGHERRTTAGPG